MRSVLAQIRHTVSESAFLRSVLVLAGGAALGRGIVILFAPALTRIYTPDDFGALATFASLISVVMVVLSLRYEQAIVLPERPREAIALLGLSLGLAFTLSLTITTILWIKRDVLFLQGNLDVGFLWLLPFGFMGAGLYQAMSLWALRVQAVERIARTRLVQGFSSVLSQLTLGLAGFGSLGLLVGEVVGRVGGTCSLIRLLRGITLRELFDVQEILYVAKRYIRFPLYNSWAALLNTLSLQLPFLILPSLFNSDVAGFFSLAYSVLGLPSFLIGQAVGQAFFSRAARLTGDPEGLARFTTKTALGLLSLVIAVFPVIAVGGPDFFSLVFGESWRQAGVYAQIMTPWYMLWLVSSPLSGILALREWQGAGLAFTVAELLSRALALWVGGRLGSDVLAVALVSLAGFGISLAALISFLRAGYVNLRYIGLKALLFLAIGCIYASCLWMITAVIGLFGLLIAIPMASMGVYWWIKSENEWTMEGRGL